MLIYCLAIGTAIAAFGSDPVIFGLLAFATFFMALKKYA